MNEETVRPVCLTCGRIAQDESAARLAWTFGVENGRQVWTCDRAVVSTCAASRASSTLSGG